MTGMAIPAIKSYAFGYDPAFLVSQTSITPFIEFASNMYFPTYCHLTPYFIGLLVAYLMETKQVALEDVKGYRKTALLFYFGFVGVFYFPGVWNSFQVPVTPFVAGLYSLLHRLIFTLGFLSFVFHSKDLYLWYLRLFERKQVKNIATDANDNQLEVDQVVKQKTIISQAIRLSRLSFKTFSKLYFSLYLVHSIFVRYDWFTSRSLITFKVYPNVSKFVREHMILFIILYYFYVFLSNRLSEESIVSLDQ
jgi:hypothetical protein